MQFIISNFLKFNAHILINNVIFSATEIMIWILLLGLSIVLFLPLSSEKPIAEKRHSELFPWNAPAIATMRRGPEKKRGLDIGLRVKVPTPTAQKSHSWNILEKEIENLEKEIKKDKGILTILNKTAPTEPLLLKPAFDCDRWESRTRTCWVDRNVGDTVTFSLSTGFESRHSRPDVVWKREFAQKNSRIMKELVINPHKSSRNLVIGRRGYELRISPVTELDIDDNQFSAAFVERNNNVPSNSKVNFRIRIVSTDLGFVYIGETLDLAIESFVTLPMKSVSFHWYTEKEGEHATLPSNMRVSPSGETLRISELRQEQEGVITCSIYTNKDIQATKKRFLIKDLVKNKDVLKAFSSHNITFQEENLKRHAKTLGHKVKRTTHIKTEESHHKIHKNRRTKKQREVNEANVEGDLYTIVRSNDNASYNAIPKLPEDIINSAGKNRNGHLLSFNNSSDMDAIVNINMNQEKNIEDDKVSRIVSYCTADLQCSKHATCVRSNLKDEGFCRCLPSFYGPGIFCREEM